MRVARIQASDMQTALEQVRGKLGPDAVIISTRGLGSTSEERSRGLRGIEIVAGTDEQPAKPPALRGPAPVAVGGVAAAAARFAYSRTATEEKGEATAETASAEGERITLAATSRAARVTALEQMPVTAPVFPRVDRDGEDLSDEMTPFAALHRRAMGLSVNGITTVVPSARETRERLAEKILEREPLMEDTSYIPASPRRATVEIAPAPPPMVEYVPSPAHNTAMRPAAAVAQAPAPLAPRASQAQTAPLSTPGRGAAHEAAERAYQVLREMGLAEGAVESALAAAINVLPREALADGDRLLEVALSRLIAGLPAGMPLTAQTLAGKAVFFVGPSGVGKTTALLKAATELRATGADVRVIGADVSHLGSAEQLTRYGQLLGLPVMIAYATDELQSAVASVPAGQVTLVDTAACRVRATRAVSTGSADAPFTVDETSAELADLIAATPNRLVVLTVAAGTGEADLHRLAAAGEAFTADAVAITKLDEAVSPDGTEAGGAGGALNVLAHLRLPPLLCSTGRDVLEEMLIASVTDLAVAALDAVAGSPTAQS